MRQTECKRADRGCSIVADPFQGPHASIIGREQTGIFPGDLTGRRMEVPGAAVIPQTLPQLHHFVLVRPGQRPNVGKTFHETQVILQSLRNPRLLQDNFRYPDPVGIGSLTPGQLPAVGFVPPNQYCAYLIG